MGLGQLALSGILGALAQPGLEPGEGPRAPTLQLPDRHADLPGDGLDRLTPQQAQHHLVLASQAPALAGRERTSPGGRPWDGRHGRAALALAAHKPTRIDHRLSITFHAVVLQFLGTIRCPEKPRAAHDLHSLSFEWRRPSFFNYAGHRTTANKGSRSPLELRQLWQPVRAIPWLEGNSDEKRRRGS